MKLKHLVLLIAAMGMLLAFPLGFTKSWAQGQSQSEWERVVENARAEGKVVVYGDSIGTAKNLLMKVLKDKFMP